MSIFWNALKVVLVAVVLFVMRNGIGIPPLRNAHGNTGGVPRLGDPTYDIQKLVTPRVDGIALCLLARIGTAPIIGDLSFASTKQKLN